MKPFRLGPGKWRLSSTALSSLTFTYSLTGFFDICPNLLIPFVPSLVHCVVDAPLVLLVYPVAHHVRAPHLVDALQLTGANNLGHAIPLHFGVLGRDSPNEYLNF
jgi:hypothetical protein